MIAISDDDGLYLLEFVDRRGLEREVERLRLKLVWAQLMRTPYGQTRTYAKQSETIGQSIAYRAVANANGANQIAIVIPCHCIINSNGNLGGYGGGIMRKQWLIDHEK